MATNSLRCSVVVPVFNRPDELRALLQRLAAQTMSRDAFEVLVCDDGSAEPLDAVVEEFRQTVPHIRLLRQGNRGPAAARNLGIAHAASEVVLFLDSDVLPHPDVVRRLTEGIENHPAWTGSEAVLLPTGGEETVVWDAPRNHDGGRFHTAGIAYRRAVLLAVGGLDECFARAACEDVELAVQVQRHGPIGFVPEAVVQHPRRRRSIASAWKARANWRSVQILACRHGFVGWPWHPTRWPRLETALCAAVKLPIGRALTALKSLRRSPADGLAGLGLACVDCLAGLCMVPTIFLGSVPPRRSRFLTGK